MYMHDNAVHHSVEEIVQLGDVLSGNVVSVVGRFLISDLVKGLFHVDRDHWYMGTLRPSEWGSQLISIELSEDQIEQLKPVYHKYCDNPLVKVEGYFQLEPNGDGVKRIITAYNIEPVEPDLH